MPVRRDPRTDRRGERARAAGEDDLVVTPKLADDARSADALVDLRATETPRRLRLLAFMQTVSDLLCLALVVAAFDLFGELGNGAAIAPALVLGLTWVLVFRAFSLDALLQFPLLEEVRRIFSATSVGTLMVVVILGTWERNVTGSPLGLAWLSLLGLEFLTRRGWRAYASRLRTRGELSLRTLVVGTNDEAIALVRGAIVPNQGYLSIGFLSTSAIAASHEPPGTIWGRLDDLDDVVNSQEVACVFVASSALSAREMLRVAKACRHLGVELRVSANLPPTISSRLVARRIGKTSTLAIRPPHFVRSQQAGKRMMDILLSSVALILASPVLLCIAVVIRVTSPGPVIFRQPRVTRGGRTFTVYKFRTMEVRSAREEHLIDLTQPFFKLEDDPRSPASGGSCEDEPGRAPAAVERAQGDMSLVGPRPLPVEQVRPTPSSSAAARGPSRADRLVAGQRAERR